MAEPLETPLPSAPAQPATEPEPEPAAAAPPPPVPAELLQSAVESLLFVSGQPISLRKLSELLGGAETAALRAALAAIGQRHEAPGSGIVLEELAGGFLMRTRAELAPWVEPLITTVRRRNLTPAMLETLAIVAYKQPVTRADVDTVRGVNSGAHLRVLIEQELIQVVGKADLPGQPVLYGTTKDFLEHFGLKSLKDLPRP